MAREYVRRKRVKETDRLPIPLWDPGSGKYAFGLLCCPDDPYWIAHVRGVISKLGIGWTWDKTTGDHKMASAIGADIGKGLCFMQCDDLLTVLSGIRDAIIANSNNGIIEALSQIDDTIDDVMTYDDLDVAQYLKEISDRLEGIGSDIARLSPDIVAISDQLAIEGDDLNLTISTALGDGAQKLVDIDDVLERLLTQSSLALDAYGVVSANQALILNSIDRAIREKQFSTLVSTPEVIYQPPIESSPEGPLNTDDNLCVSAKTYVIMHAMALNTLSEALAPNPLWIYNASDAYMRIMKSTILSLITVSPYEGLKYAIGVFGEYLENEFIPDYEALRVELIQHEDEIGAIYYRYLKGYIGIDEVFEGFDNEVTPALAQWLKLSDMVTFASYAWSDYLGDNSAFWDNFRRERLKVEDGYSSGACDDYNEPET